MSYCRWSTNDFQCDLYVFASCYGGYEINIRKTRPVFTEPLPAVVPFDKDHVKEWLARDNIVRDMLHKSALVPIGLLHDGKTFSGDLEETISTLENLCDLGYKFPLEIIDEIKEDGENAKGDAP